MPQSNRQDPRAAIRPPALARWALHRLLSRSHLWAIGDLDEEFLSDAVARMGRRAARLWYWREAISLFIGFARERRRSRKLSRLRRPPLKGDPLMQTLLQDVRFALRSFARQPVFTAAAMLTLALGIGAVSAIFSLVNAVVLKPFPYLDAHQIVIPATTSAQRGLTRSPVAYPDYLQWREESGLFQQLALISGTGGDLSADGEPVRLSGTAVTQDFFDLMRAKPVLGRLFDPQEYVPGNPGVILISRGLWQSRFGGEPSVLGRKIDLSGRQVQVVGVLDASTLWPQNAQFWRPLAYPDPPTPVLQRLDNFAYRAVARLQPGVGLEQAQARLAALALRTAEENPELRKGWGIQVYRLDKWIVRSQLRLALWVLLGAVGLVLLIVCVNLANLLLARAASRGREIGIRLALGAGRRRLVRQMLTESLTLSAAGALLGLLVAALGVRLLTAFPQNIPRLAEAAIDPVVLLFTMGTAVFTALFFGLFPALQISRKEPAQSLKEAVHTVTGSGSSRRFQNFLVCAEISLSLTLLIVTGLLLQSFSRIYNADPGVRTENVLTLFTALPAGRYPQKSQADAFFEQALERLGQLPQIESAAAASSLPLGGGGMGLGRSHLEEGAPQPPGGPEYSALWVVVSDQYFRTLGIPVLQGRGFDSQDHAESVPTIIINQAMSRAMFGDRDPLGARIRSWRDEDLLRQVVGLVGNVRQQGMEDADRPIVYVSYRQLSFRALRGLVMHTRSDPMEAIPAVQAQIWDLDSKLPLILVRSMEQILDRSMGTRRYLSTLLLAFAVSALLLAAVGIYGVVSFMAGRRRQEIGIRIALGARGSAVMGLILRHGMLLAGLGVGAGLVLSLAVSHTARGLLYEVSPIEPLAYLVGALLLGAIAALASLIPAWRASKVDPLKTLRWE